MEGWRDGGMEGWREGKREDVGIMEGGEQKESNWIILLFYKIVQIHPSLYLAFGRFI